MPQIAIQMGVCGKQNISSALSEISALPTSPSGLCAAELPTSLMVSGIKVNLLFTIPLMNAVTVRQRESQLMLSSALPLTHDVAFL